MPGRPPHHQENQASGVSKCLSAGDTFLVQSISGLRPHGNVGRARSSGTRDPGAISSCPCSGVSGCLPAAQHLPQWPLPVASPVVSALLPAPLKTSVCRLDLPGHPCAARQEARGPELRAVFCGGAHGGAPDACCPHSAGHGDSGLCSGFPPRAAAPVLELTITTIPHPIPRNWTPCVPPWPGPHPRGVA